MECPVESMICEEQRNAKKRPFEEAGESQMMIDELSKIRQDFCLWEAKSRVEKFAIGMQGESGNGGSCC